MFAFLLILPSRQEILAKKFLWGLVLHFLFAKDKLFYHFKKISLWWENNTDINFAVQEKKYLFFQQKCQLMEIYPGKQILDKTSENNCFGAFFQVYIFSQRGFFPWGLLSGTILSEKRFCIVSFSRGIFAGWHFSGELFPSGFSPVFVFIRSLKSSFKAKNILKYCISPDLHIS